ncbi:MAG: hypothetical protein JOY99_01505 [Sphingomonadaceae bacterium]|nr:hypothetical protein [Sphingomonadaceae bacterium]
MALILLLGALAEAFAYWPGLMTWDAIRQYGQALDGDFDDWHPPAMEWLWRQLVSVHPGPAPMLILQLALYWGGFALLAGWALRERRRGLAVALVACAFLPVPFALMGAVLKDCLMAGALLSATGLLAWNLRVNRWSLRIPALLLLVFAAMLRFNAFTACLPLFVALLPAEWRRTRLRLAIVSMLSLVPLLAAMPVANRLIGVQKSGVELSLVMFDMGGITYHSGVSVFPPMGIADPVGVNRRCYSPVKWDPYSWWVAEPCPIGFEKMHALIGDRSGYGPWLKAIAAHPIAYAEHRLAHFNINSRFLVHDEIERPVQDSPPPNDWHYRVPPNRVLTWIDRAARLSAHSPLGWPIVWIAIAFGVLLLVPALPSASLILPLALSSLLYGLGYGVFSVAAELRYHFWTMSAAAIALVLTIADLKRGAGISCSRIATAALPALIVTTLCIIWRLA